MVFPRYLCLLGVLLVSTQAAPAVSDKSIPLTSDGPPPNITNYEDVLAFGVV